MHPLIPHGRLGIFETTATPDGDIVVAVGLTHNVADAVKAYPAGGGAGSDHRSCRRRQRGSVRSGRHTFDLAEALTAEIKRLRESASGGDRRIHIFMAAPGAFSFVLGQRQVALGHVTLYEFDFEGAQGGSYQPSLTFPVTAK